MTGSRIARAGELVDQLAGAGVKATTDPQHVAGSAPCVLVAPPRLQLSADRHVVWQLYVIAGSTVPSLATWQTLDELVDQLDELLPLSAATPASWAPAAGVDPMPAYLVTYEEAIA
jgi:hypothetical protein